MSEDVGSFVTWKCRACSNINLIESYTKKRRIRCNCSAAYKVIGTFDNGKPSIRRVKE